MVRCRARKKKIKMQTIKIQQTIIFLNNVAMISPELETKTINFILNSGSSKIFYFNSPEEMKVARNIIGKIKMQNIKIQQTIIFLNNVAMISPELETKTINFIFSSGTSKIFYFNSLEEMKVAMSTIEGL